MRRDCRVRKHNMARGERYSVQRLKEELSRKYNAAQIDDIDIFAGEVMPHLPAGLRGDLERSGLLYYPPFFEKLAAIGERLRDGTTEQGMARLKEIYSEEE